MQLNPRLASCLKLIPRSAKHIALVGTEAVHIGQAFRSFAPACKQQRFPNIRQLLQHVKQVQLAEGPFDAIMIAGHLYEGAGLQENLAVLRSAISKSGVIILEILNPFYFARLDKKIKEGKPYPLEFLKGLFGRTRTYSEDLKEDIAGAGLLVEHLFRDEASGFANWIGTRKQEVPGYSKLIDQIAPTVCSPHFLFQLNTTRVPQIRIQAQILKPVGGVNDVRIIEPLEALSSLPGILSDARREQKVVQGHPEVSKVFLWHRPILTLDKSIKYIQELRRAGYLIITEFDDHHTPWPEIASNNFLTFAGVHAVQTTKPVLARLFEHYNPEVAVFPNQLARFPDRDLKVPSDRCRIFFGALNRQNDWASILPAINEVLPKIQGDFWFDVVKDEAFFEALETDNKSFSAQCSYEDYKGHLLSADISFMPLLNTDFNRMKSDLKLVEAAGHGAVPLASSLVYEKTDPKNSFSEVCESPEAFAAALKKLVEDKEYRLVKQQKGRAYVRDSRLLSQHVESRYDWLKDLIVRREELDRALDERLQAILGRQG